MGLFMINYRFRTSFTTKTAAIEAGNAAEALARLKKTLNMSKDAKFFLVAVERFPGIYLQANQDVETVAG